MVAVVSGNSLGLLNSSLSTLGAGGAFGNALTGRAGQGAWVNAATGNLVLQNQDDYLASVGLDLALGRTYNSQGLLADDNGDNWQLGAYKKLVLTGTLNKAGSSFTRYEGDGSSSTYSYDGTRKKYVCTDGGGAYDTISASPKSWVWTDGDTGTSETYDWATGRIASSADTDGNTITYGYTGQLLTSITDAGGGKLLLDYTGNLLTQVRATFTDATGAHTQTRTRYTYDSANRLSQVTTDLSPQDNSVADNNVYWTRYTYDGASRRVASMTQTDGSSLTFTYVQSGGAYRVETVTDGERRLTRYGYDTAARTTSVTDPLGNLTVYAYDAAGQLLQVTAPAVDGVSQVTRYAYNANGDVATVTDPRGNTVRMTYDANGNAVQQQDALGNTVRRVFSTTNHVVVETVFTTPDADGAGPADPADPLTTRYAYDRNDQLRFVVTPEGRVTEYQYDRAGNRTAAIQYTGAAYDVSALAPTTALAEADLTTWLGTIDRTAAIRTDYTYDSFNFGQLQTATTWATLKGSGTGLADGQQSVVNYSYSASGQLLQTVDANGNQTSFAYDGLFRVIASTDANNVVTTSSYDDAGNRTTVKLASGLWTTSTYNRAGELVSVSQTNAGGSALGTSTFAYDADGRRVMETDATGRRAWHLYDAASRKVADVDASGSLVEYRYNADNQVTRTLRYATAVDTSLLANAAGAPLNPSLASIRPAASADDRSAWTVYDAAGRAVQSIDGEGYVTQTVYDGASRVMQVTAYATAVGTAALGDQPAAVAPAAAADDRVSRNFYDKDGRLAGLLDAEGYLTTYTYDAGGQRVGSIAYATATDAALRATGTLAQLVPAAAAQDIAGTRFYDRKGRLVGTVDGENYLTEQVYDLAGNLARKIRYAARVTPGATLAATRPVADANDQAWTSTYTALNRLSTQTAPDGTVTRYVYDNVGNLVETTRGWQSDDARTATRRYDVQGRLVAELSGEGSARLATATTQAAIDAVWAAYSTKYGYDAAGRRISTTDADGNRTLHYYDASGRLVADVNGMGDVAARSYDGLGNLAKETRFARRITGAALAALTGGDASSIAGQLAALADAANDTVTQYFYDHDGRLTRSVDALNFATDYGYDAFDLRTQRETIDATHSLLHNYGYDHRGLRLEDLADPSGLAVRQTTAYDAFGRAIESHDANGHVTTRSYDRLGQLVALRAPIGGTTTSYDAFGRVLVQTDATNRSTVTTYDTANRKMTVTLPDGVTMVTVTNRHGQTFTFADGNRDTTTYTYDKDGRVTDVTDRNGRVEHDEWDAAGNRLQTIDAKGTATKYEYDAANRVFRQTVDPTGLKLETLYSYDTAGRVLTVTDPRQVVTQSVYDAKGQLRTVTVDPAGLNLTTRTEYDGRSRTLTVTDPSNRVTAYGYDTLGRRTSETIAGLTTHYYYDPAGNVVAREDAAHNITRYVYDASDRQVYEIDASGGVIATTYDDAGRVVLRLSHTVAVSASWLAGLAPGQVLQPADVAAQLGGVPAGAQAAASAKAIGEERILDSNGRVAFTVDTVSGLVRYEYDGNGNVIKRTAYARALGTSVPHTLSDILANLPAPDTTPDRITTSTYDARNRLARQLDAGALTVYSYDANGNVTEQVTYAATVSSIDETPADSEADRRVRMAYDAGGRITARATAQHSENGVLQYAAEKFTYDNAGNLQVHRQFAARLSAAAYAGDTAAWVGTLAQDDAADRVESFTYDNAGRLAGKVGAENAVCDYAYDAAGNLTAKTEYASTAADNRVTRTVYDSAGRAVYEIGAEGAVMQRIYDGAGRVTKTIHYANAIPTLATYDTTSVAAALRRDDVNDRVEQNVYDSAGHLRFTIDATGAVKENKYDAAGHIKAITRYSVRVSDWGAQRTPDQWTETDLTNAWSALLGADANSRTDIFHYDTAGRLQYSIDSLGYTENYEYDALGNKTKFQNKSGAEWDYAYDAAGRLLKETTPDVDVSTLTVAADQSISLATAAHAVETVMTYDALGNLITRTEAAGLAAERTTRYDYDAAGRQVKTTFPKVDVDGVAHDSLFATVTYDMLGNAVRSVDVANNTSSKGYDRAGRVISETDAEGGVTRYGRNAFGEVTSLTRQAGVAPSSADRTIVTTYDRMGRAVQVEQPLKQITRTDYDAFGDAVKVTTGTSATHYYFDRAGRRVGQLAELDARNGYFTETQYDVDGNAIDVHEYAALVSTGTDFGNYQAVRDAALKVAGNDDRVLRTTYDGMDRKRTETRVGRYTGTTAGTESLQTTFFYDAVGNLTGPRDAAGAITATRYDALGRKIAVIAPARADIDGANAVTPLTEFQLDAYGNVLSRTDYAGGAEAIAYQPPANSGPSTPDNYLTATYAAKTFDPARDRHTYSQYDALGHMTGETDALGNITIHGYDAAGRLARTFTNVKDNGAVTGTAYTANVYDKVGRLTDVVTPGSLPNTQVDTHTAYNSFGEVVSRNVNGLEVEHNDIDAAGRVWRTTGSDGVTHVFVRDVDGRVTQDITNADQDLRGAADLDAALQMTGNRVTRITYDALGNVVSREAPAVTEHVTSSTEQIAFVQVQSTARQIQLTYPSLAGLGGSDVKVQVEYETADGSTQIPAPQIFEAWQVQSGATLEIGNDKPAVSRVTHVTVSKKDNDGNWVALIDRNGTSAWGAWITLQAPDDPAQAVQLKVRAHGTSNAFVALPDADIKRFGDRLFYAYDASRYGIADVDYELHFGDAVADSGTFSIKSKIADIPTAGRPHIVNGAFTWSAPADPNTREVLMYREQPNGDWVAAAVPIANADGQHSIQLTALPMGRFDYELLFYSGPSDDTLYAHANGTLTVGPKVDFGHDAVGTPPDQRNVLTWAPPDRAGAAERIEIASIDYSTDPPVAGAWRDVTSWIGDYGSKHGISLDALPPGAVDFRLSFLTQAGGPDYVQTSGGVYVMPSVVANASALPATLSWTAPPPTLVIDGHVCDVIQVLRASDVETGHVIDESTNIDNLGGGLNGLSFARLGLLNGFAHAFDYSLEWRVAARDIVMNVSLGVVRGHVRFGLAQPALDQTSGATELTWTVPADLTGARMQSHLLVRAKGELTYVEKQFDLAADGTATFDASNVEPAEYEYQIKYQGYETAGGPLVDWGVNEGSGVIVSRPALSGHVLSWPASTMGVTTTLTTGVGTISSANGRESIDFTGRAPGDYAYVLTFTKADGTVLGTASGTVHIVPEPALNGTLLSWTAPEVAWPNRHVTQLLQAAVHGTGNFQDIGVVSSAGTYSRDLGGLPPSAWDYRLTFTDTDTHQTLGVATGTVAVLPAPHTGTVAGFNIPTNAVTWVAAPAGFHTVVRFRLDDGTATDFNTLPAVSGPLASYTGADGSVREGIVLADVAAGKYDYQVEYVFDAGGASFAKMQGTLAAAPLARLLNAHPADGFTHDTPVLHWAQPSAQVTATTLVLHNAQGDTTYQNFGVRDFGTGASQYVSLDGLPTGGYSYTLSFTLASGETLTSVGSFLHAAAATVQGSAITWDTPPAGFSAVLRWRFYGAQGGFPNVITSFTPQAGGRQGYDLAGVAGSGDYEYELDYIDSLSNVVATTEGELRLLPTITMGVVGSTMLAWETPPADVTQQFLYSLSGANNFVPFAGPQPLLDGIHTGIDLKNTAAGDYDIQVVMTRNGQAWGTSSATVRVIAQANFGNDAASDSILSWPAPTPGVTASLQVTRNGSPVAVQLRADGHSVDFGDSTAYPYGTYNYTLTFLRGAQTIGSTQGSFSIAVPPTVALDGSAQYGVPQGDWNAANDFPLSGPSTSGAFSWGYVTSLGGALTLYPQRMTFGTLQGMLDNINSNAPGAWKNTSTTATYYNGSQHVGPGKMIIHPGPTNQISVVRWTAPSTGRFQLDTSLYPADSTTTEVWVLKGGTTLLHGHIGGTLAYNGAIDVTAGDTIDVAVGNDGSFYSDSTGVDFDIRPLQAVDGLGKTLSWPTPAAGTSQVFTYVNRDVPGQSGTFTEGQIPVLANGLSGFDLSVLAPGHYDWTLTSTPAGGTPVITSGDTIVEGDPSANAAGQISWPAGDPGQTATTYYLDPAGTQHTLDATLSGSTYTATIPDVPAGDYAFWTIYSDANGQYARVDSTLHVAPAGSAPGAVDNPNKLNVGLMIAKATDSSGNPTTRITFNALSGATTFRYQDATGWHYLGVSTLNGVSTVDIGAVPSGTFNYELLLQNGSTYSHATGTFTLSHAGETYNLAVQPINGVTVNSIGQVLWQRPNHVVTRALFHYRLVGTSTWNESTPVPLFPGSTTYAVYAGNVSDGTYESEIFYYNTNPATGDEVLTDAARGYITRTTTPGTPTPAVPPDLAVSVSEAYYTGDPPHRIINLGTPAPSMTYTSASLSIPVPIKGAPYNVNPDNHAVYVELEPGVYSRVYYRFSLLNNGTEVAYSDGYYTDTGAINGASVADNYHDAAAASSGTATVAYAYSALAAPSSTTDTVPGTPINPSLTTTTPDPTPAGKTYSVFGAQDRYFYRGANPTWTLSASSVTGVSATPPSERLVLVDYGNTGTIANVSAVAYDITTAMQLTQSNTNVQESADATVTAQFTAGSQHQLLNQTGIQKDDARFGNTSPYSTQDATLAGTVPVSVPFKLNYVDAKLDSTPADVTLTAKVASTFDRWGDTLTTTDARNATTTYSYNAAGQVLRQTKPTAGAQASVTTATYDVQGHTARVTDANGNPTTMTYDGAGNLIEQASPDGGHVYNRYDAFGERTEKWVQTAANQFAVTQYGYDLDGRLTRVEQPDTEVRITGRDPATGQYVTAQVAGTQVDHWSASEAQQYDPVFNTPTNKTAEAQQTTSAHASTETYSYDSLGRRTREILTDGYTGEVTQTTYDLAGNVIQQQTPDDKVTVYRYDALGRKTSQVDATGREMTWTYDGASNRVRTHVGLDGVTVDSTYDNAGELRTESTRTARVVGSDPQHDLMGESRTYSYDARGEVSGIVDQSQAGVVQTTTYRYDAAGSRTLERTESTHDGHTATLQDNHLRYDAQGRLTQSEDGRVKIDYTYDAAGNRIRMQAAYINDSDHAKNFDYGYSYDAMNRLVIEQGAVASDGSVSFDPHQGNQYSYDLAGRRITAETFGKSVEHSTRTYVVADADGTGTLSFTEDNYAAVDGTAKESYRYDAAGNLVSIARNAETRHLNADGSLSFITQDALEIQQRHYDLRGRLVQQQTPGALADVHNEGSGAGQDYQPPPPMSGARGAVNMLNDIGYSAQSTTLMYEARSDRVHRQTSRQVGWNPGLALEDGALQSNVGCDYDTAGNLTKTTVESSRANGDSTTTNTWQAIGDADRQVKAVSEGHGASANVQQHYDGAGRLISLLHDRSTPDNPDRRFYSDVGGRVLESRHLTADGADAQGAGMRERYAIVNGEQVARTADDSIEAGYTDSFGKPDIFGASPSAPHQATGARGYIVQEGDTLQKIARAVYGDESLWYAIAEANGIASPTGITAGQVLTLPDAAGIGAGTHNSATTLRPYDASKAIGDTSPNLPAPAHAGGCGGVGQVIAIVIAVVVTIYTAGAFALATEAGVAGGATAASTAAAATAATGSTVAGTFAAGTAALSGTFGAAAGIGAGLVGGAVGSIASQGFSLAAGIQEKFSWKQVALSAIAGGVDGGLEGWAPLGGDAAEVGNTIIRSAVGNAASQAIGVATGLQDHFSWRSTAAAAVGGGVGAALGPVFGDALGKGSFSARLATGLAAGTAAAVARGGRVTVQQIAVDAFGNAVGSSLVQSASGAGPAIQGYGPWSDKGYVNEMDRASDRYNPATEYGHVNGADFASDNYNRAFEYSYRNSLDVQSDEYNPAFEYGYRNAMDQASDDFNPATMYAYKNGADVASDRVNQINRARALAAARGVSIPSQSEIDRENVVLGRRGVGQAAYDPDSDVQRELSRLKNARADVLPAQERMRDLVKLTMAWHSGEMPPMPSSFWNAKAQEYKDVTISLGQQFNRDSIYNGFKANAMQMAREEGRDIGSDGTNHMASVLIESGGAGAVGVALGSRSASHVNGPFLTRGAGVDLELRYREDWTPEQRAAADAKVKFLTEAPTVVTAADRSGTSAAVNRYRKTENVPRGVDVDHMQDLQLNGGKGYENLGGLDASVNRSIGAQIQQLIKNLPVGTRINKVTIRD